MVIWNNLIHLTIRLLRMYGLIPFCIISICTYKWYICQLLKNILCIWVVCLYDVYISHAFLVPTEARRCQILWNWSSCRCWESYPGPWEEKQVLLTIELCFYLKNLFLKQGIISSRLPWYFYAAEDSFKLLASISSVLRLQARATVTGFMWPQGFKSGLVHARQVFYQLSSTSAPKCFFLKKQNKTRKNRFSFVLHILFCLCV